MHTKCKRGVSAGPFNWVQCCFVFCLAAASATVALANPVSGTLVGWANDTNYLSGMPVGLSNVVAVAAAASQNYYSQNVALKSDGKVIAWGKDGSGHIRTNVPAGLNNVVAVAVGGDHFMALRRNGTVASWEGPTNCVVPAGLSNVVAIAAGNGNSMALKNDGTLAYWSNAGAISNSPAGISNNVAAVAAANFNYIVLTTNGTVVTWGTYTFGLTNGPVGATNIIGIATDYPDNMLLRGDGTVMTWGANFSGETNVPAGLSNVVAIAIGGIKGSHCLALKGDGKVVSWGAGLTNTPAGLSNVVAIAAGDFYNLAITANLQIMTMNRTNQHPSVRFHSFSGQQYSVEYSTSFGPNGWAPLPGGNIQGTGHDIEVMDTNATEAVRFYRVRQP